MDEDTDIDRLLAAGAAVVPPGFEQRVMARLRQEARPAPSVQPGSRHWRRLLRWLALAGGLGLGAAQLVAFVFGLWTAAAAG